MAQRRGIRKIMPMASLEQKPLSVKSNNSGSWTFWTLKLTNFEIGQDWDDSCCSYKIKKVLKSYLNFYSHFNDFLAFDTTIILNLSQDLFCITSHIEEHFWCLHIPAAICWPGVIFLHFCPATNNTLRFYRLLFFSFLAFNPFHTNLNVPGSVLHK